MGTRSNISHSCRTGVIACGWMSCLMLSDCPGWDGRVCAVSLAGLFLLSRVQGAAQDRANPPDLPVPLCPGLRCWLASRHCCKSWLRPPHTHKRSCGVSPGLQQTSVSFDPSNTEHTYCGASPVNSSDKHPGTSLTSTCSIVVIATVHRLDHKHVTK